MSSTTTAAPTATQTPSPGGDRTTTGAATYYGAIALAIFIMIALSISSRMLYIRRQRRVNQRERMELMRRGDAGPGLPTYRETTSPHTLSYLAHPLSQLRHGSHMDGALVPSDHPDYTAPAMPGRLYHPGDSTAPPAYIPQPPKYEEEIATTESDREAEVGGAGQEVDSTMVGRNSLSSRIGAREGQSGSNSNSAFVIESPDDVASPPTDTAAAESDEERVERMEREQARTEEENVSSESNPAQPTTRV